MGAYMMDAMRYKEGAFLASWATLALANLSMGYSTLFLDNEYPLFLALLALLLNSATLFLLGCWATLQFKWIQIQYPAVVVAFERMLMTSCLFTGGTVLYWGTVVHNGIEVAPFIVSGVFCAIYAFFARPLKSSFHASPYAVSREKEANGMIQKPLDGILSFLFIFMIPSGGYVAAHHEVLFTWTHLWSIMLLLCVPLLFAASLPKGMWWLGSSNSADALRRILVLLSFAGLLAGIEGRIVFHSFGQYIKLAPPWSYIAIAMALYGAGSIILLHVSGMMGEEIVSALLGPVLMISSSVGSLVLGFPIWAIPGPLIAAAGVSLFYESRSMRDYTLAILGSVASTAWFLRQHFSFLDVTLDGMHLRTICYMIFFAVILALLVPGMVITKVKGVGILLVIHAIILAILEEHLYAGDFLDVTFNVHPMFPASLVVGTSILGVILARQMEESKDISKVTSFALQCIFGTKIVMLAIPEARIAIPMIGFALASLHPLLLGPTGGIRNKPAPAQSVAMAAFVLVAVVTARFAVFDALHMVFDRKPSEALAAGSLLLMLAMGMMPIVSVYHKNVPSAKRAVILTGALGLLLVLLRPPLPIKGGAECPKLPLALCPRLWDASHTPEHEVDDVAVYGDGLRRREHWPLWLLVIASFFGMLAATSSIPKGSSYAPMRLIQAAMSGVLVGGYMSWEFFPGMVQVQAIILTSALLISFSLVLLSVPSKGSASLIPVLGVAWIASFPAALVVLAMTPLPSLPRDMHRLHPDVAEGYMLQQLRYSSIQTLAVACFAVESLILSFACKLRLGSTQRKSKSALGALGLGADAVYIDRAAEFLGGYVPSSISPMGTGGFVGQKYDKLKQIGLIYLPEACNLSTVFCYCLSLWINWSLDSEHSGIMTLLLSSILLLLCQDSFIFNGLTERRRYFAPYAAGAAALVFAAVWEILADTISFENGFEVYFDEYYVLINGFFIALTIPPLLEMADQLWVQEDVKAIFPVLSGLLGTLGTYFSDVEEIRALCAFGGLTALYLSATAQHRKHVGSKFI